MSEELVSGEGASFNGKPKATACPFAGAFGLPLNEYK